MPIPATAPDDTGFTLIESIAALVIAAIVITAMAPPILLSLATRLNNQHFEEAAQLAQTAVTTARMNALASSLQTQSTLAAVGAPTGLCTSSCQPTQVQQSDDGRYLVQRMYRRTTESCQFGVRVYAIPTSGTPTFSNLLTTLQAPGLTGGPNDHYRAPFSIIQTEIPLNNCPT